MNSSNTKQTHTTGWSDATVARLWDERDELRETVADMLAVLKAARGVVEAAGDFEPTPLLAQIDAAIARGQDA